MSALPAASFLMEFEAEPVAPAGLEAALAASSDIAGPQDRAPLVSEEDVAAAAADGYARGLAEATAAAETAVEARIVELAADYEHRLAAARQNWLAGEGARHAETIAKAMQDIGIEIAGTTARLLWPLVIKDVGAAALDDLVEKLEELIARDLGRDLVIAAPPQLMASLKSRLAGRLDGIAFEESGKGEVRVSAGKTVLETRITAWIDRLEEAFA